MIKIQVIRFSLMITTLLLTSVIAAAQSRLELQQKLLSSNEELKSMSSDITSQDSLKKSMYSAYLPTLNVIGGLAKNKTDEDDEKGQVRYLQGSANLFSGFKDMASVDIQDKKIALAKINYEIHVRAQKEKLTEILASMIGLHQLEKILDEEFKITQNQKQMAARKVNAGLTSQVDNYEFVIRESEIEIQKKEIKRKHEAAHQQLNALYNQEILDSEIENLSFAADPTTISGFNLKSYENHPLIQKAKITADIALFEKSVMTSDFLPKIDLSYVFGRLTPTEDNIKYNESEIALLVTIPLFSGFDTYHKRKSSIANLSAKEHEKNQILLDIKSQFEQLKSRVQELVESYQIIEKKLIVTEKYYNLTLAEYKRGTKNSPDLVGATERYFDTKKKKIEIQKELDIIQDQLNNYK